MQSDVQRDALEGTGGFAEAGPLPELRAVMALYPEPLTIVARADAGIDELDDLEGKRVALGPPGSGTRAHRRRADRRARLDARRASPPRPSSTPRARAAALCAGEVDAFLYAVGHPALAIQEATAACPAVLVDAAGPAVEALVGSDPAWSAATIPAGLYRGTPREVATFGVGATLVTRAEVPEDVVYTLVRDVFEDFETLKGLNPALVALDPEAMVAGGLTAPLHPGAERYFRERGWLP